MKTEHTFRQSIINHPVTLLVLLVVCFILGFYFEVRFVKGAFLGTLFMVVFYFINNLETQVTKLVYHKDTNQLQFFTLQYFIKPGKFLINKNSVRFTKHDYPAERYKPSEFNFILENGKVLKISTKFWKRKTMKELAKTVWGVDVES